MTQCWVESGFIYSDCSTTCVTFSAEQIQLIWWLGDDTIILRAIAEKLQNARSWSLACEYSSIWGWWPCMSYIDYYALLGVQSIVINPSMCLCVCVCLSVSISLEPLDRSLPNFMCRSPVAMARSSWQHCTTLCASGFTDDVTFGHSITVHWLSVVTYSAPRGVARPGWSLM